MSLCMPSLLYPFPSRTSLLSPSGLRHRKHLATAAARCSGNTDPSSLVIQHISDVKLRFPYVLLDVASFSAERTLRLVATAVVHSPCWDLSQPCSHQTYKRIIRGFSSLKRWGRDKSRDRSLS